MKEQRDADAGTLTCTKLLDWYGGDFGDGSRAKLERVLFESVGPVKKVALTHTICPTQSAVHSAILKLFRATLSLI